MKIIALSALIDLAAWKLGGRAVYDHARAGTALTTHEAQTYWFALALFFIPPVAGYACAKQSTPWRVASPTRPNDSPIRQPTRHPMRGRCVRDAAPSVRSCLGFSMRGRRLGTGPGDVSVAPNRSRTRVVTTGGREIVGVVAHDSRVALSPQPRDLYLEQILRQADDGNFYPTAYGLGAFLAGAEIESVEWVSQQGLITTTDTDG